MKKTTLKRTKNSNKTKVKKSAYELNKENNINYFKFNYIRILLYEYIYHFRSDQKGVMLNQLTDFERDDEDENTKEAKKNKKNFKKSA